MNIWLGIITLLFILVTALIIYIKQKKIRYVIWNLILFIVAGTSFWFGHDATEGWRIMLCSIIVGGCWLTSAIHAFNKIFTSGKVPEYVGETRKPKSFGNGYWH